MAAQSKQLRYNQIYLRKYPIGPGMIFIWVVGALGMGVAVYRWLTGLGTTTNLNDGRPWGLWISFDMMSGIGLAAGAFTVAAVVYIFNIKRFYPIVRPAILTGFISYLLAALTLLADLGQPQRIWHLIVYWNIHSPLFEIGWCEPSLTPQRLCFATTVQSSGAHTPLGALSRSPGPRAGQFWPPYRSEGVEGCSHKSSPGSRVHRPAA